MNLGKRPDGQVLTEYFALKGGLRLEDPPLSAIQGALLAAENFECLSEGGYRRLAGYERYDGQTSPSLASYWVLNFENGSAAISEGDTVTGASSSATGEALVDAVVTSGSYGGGDAAGYLVLTAVSGTFTDTENLQVSAVTKSTADGTAVENGADNDTDNATWSQDAIETQRANIAAIPGSGKVRGIAVYNGNLYCFRDNAGATACVMHKATSSGWSAQDLGNKIEFTAGTAEFAEGETLTGGTSTASATINRVVVQTGDWSTNDAAGYLVIGTVTSGPYQAETGTSASGSATLSGAESANSLAAGGRFEFREHNFFGGSGTKRLYGVDGVSQGFEWDGTIFVPIDTGNTTDTPTHIEIHKEHLFYAFAGGSLQHSGPGLPYNWLSGDGASEIGVGDDLVGMQKQTGGTMAVFSDEQTHVLYGSDSSDWDLKTLSDEAGATEWTIRSIGGRTRYMDDRGMLSLSSVQEFGDFKSAELSQAIDRLIESKRGTEIASLAVKNKNQYRLFFNDNTGIIATFNGHKLAGFTTFNYGKTAECIGSGKDSTGGEIMFFGDDSGYVYQIDKGTSFDGSAVDASLQLTYTHLGSPSYNKRFRKVTLELESPAGAIIKFQPQYNYGSALVPVGQIESQTMDGAGGYWDTSIWDQFYWASEEVTLMEGDMDGEARNISLRIFSSSTYIEPYTLSGIIYHYSMRRLVR